MQGLQIAFVIDFNYNDPPNFVFFLGKEWYAAEVITTTGQRTGRITQGELGIQVLFIMNTKYTTASASSPLS